MKEVPSSATTNLNRLERPPDGGRQGPVTRKYGLTTGAADQSRSNENSNPVENPALVTGDIHSLAVPRFAKIRPTLYLLVMKQLLSRLLSTAAVLSSVLSAQVDAPKDQAYYSPWGEPTAQGITFHRLLPGKLFSRYADVLAVRTKDGSRRAVLLQDPYRFDLFADLGEVADAGLLENGGPTGMDAFVLQTASGLRAYTVGGGHIPAMVSQLTTNGWQSVTKVFCVRSAAGSHRILGLDASRNALLLADFSAISGQLTHVTEKPVPPGVLDVQAMHWVPTSIVPDKQLVVQTADAVFVCTWDVTAFHYIYTGVAFEGVAPQVAVSRGAGATAADRDRLCIYARVFDQFRLTVVNSENAELYDLGQRRLGKPAMVQRSDGYADLGFPVLTGSEVLRLRRQPGSGSSFHQVSAAWRYPLVQGSVAPMVSPSTLCFADLDGDGDQDLFAAQSHVDPGVGGGPPAAWNATQTFLDATFSGLRPHLSVKTGGAQGQGASSLNIPLRVRVPNAFLGYVPPIGESWKFRIEAWVQPADNGPLNLNELLRVADQPVTDWSSFADMPVAYTSFYNGAGLAIDPSRYVLNLHVSLVRTVAGPQGETVYPSSLHILPARFAHLTFLQQQIATESAGSPVSISGPGDGDGTTGSRVKPASGGNTGGG